MSIAHPISARERRKRLWKEKPSRFVWKPTPMRGMPWTLGLPGGNREGNKAWAILVRLDAWEEELLDRALEGQPHAMPSFCSSILSSSKHLKSFSSLAAEWSGGMTSSGSILDLYHFQSVPFSNALQSVQRHLFRKEKQKLVEPGGKKPMILGKSHSCKGIIPRCGLSQLHSKVVQSSPETSGLCHIVTSFSWGTRPEKGG